MDVSSLGGFLQNLLPGENIYDAIRSELFLQAFPKATASHARQLWVLFGFNVVILLLCGIGIGARYKRGSGTAWLFMKESNGLLRPNTAMVTQVCFAVYAVFFLILVPIYSLKRRPSEGAFAFLMLIFVPLVFALHATCWATALAPSTSMRFLSPSRTSALVTGHGPVASGVAIGIGGLFLLSIIPPMVYLARAYKHQNQTLDALLDQLENAKALNLGVAGLATLLPFYENILKASSQLSRYYKAITGTYLGWIVIWMMIYIPTALRLILALRSRSRRYQRSIKSLRVLNEIVSHVGPGDQPSRNDDGVSQPPRVVSLPPTSPPTYPPTPTRTNQNILPPIHSTIEPTSSDGDSITSNCTFNAPRSGWRVSSSEHGHPKASGKLREGPERGPRAESQLKDLEKTLRKTQLMLRTLVVQCVVTLMMTSSVIAFIIYCYLCSPQALNKIFLIWIGYTFTLSGLVLSSAFAVFSIRGPRIVPDPTPATAPPFSSSPVHLPTSPHYPDSPPPSSYHSAMSNFFLRTIGGRRKQSLSDGRDTATSPSSTTASPTEIAMEEGEIRVRDSPRTFASPPRQKWVPSDWAQAQRRDQSGEVEVLAGQR